MVISIITPSEEKELKQLAKKLNITVAKKDFYHGEIVDEKPVKRPTYAKKKK